MVNYRISVARDTDYIHCDTWEAAEKAAARYINLADYDLLETLRNANQTVLCGEGYTITYFDTGFCVASNNRSKTLRYLIAEARPQNAAEKKRRKRMRDFIGLYARHAAEYWVAKAEYKDNDWATEEYEYLNGLRSALGVLGSPDYNSIIAEMNAIDEALYYYYN